MWCVQNSYEGQQNGFIFFFLFRQKWKIVQNHKLDTLQMTDVEHKIICKRSNEIFFLIFVEIVEHQTPIELLL
jgi:hypothetical protein